LPGALEAVELSPAVQELPAMSLDGGGNALPVFLDRLADIDSDEEVRPRLSFLVPETGREVALPEVVEQSHEASRSLATGDAFDPHHVGPGGLADEKARAG